MTIEFPIELLDDHHENGDNHYRWSIGFFFGLIAVPFVAIWLITQGPKSFEMLNPTFSVLSVGEISEIGLGVVIRNATFRKHHACETTGSIYLSGIYPDGRSKTEVLIAAYPMVGSNQLFLKNVFDNGETFIIPEMRFITSKAVLSKMWRFRFMLPCKLPFLGEVASYTNSFDIN